jgi:predicted DNA-binding transcriptional regulator AlpA
VKRSPKDPSAPLAPDEDLRDALRRHAEVCDHKWRAQVQPDPDSPESRRSARRITVRLTLEDAAALAGLIRDAADRHTAAQDRTIGTAEVAKQINNAPSTIRAWLARGQPEGNPFPTPRKILGRSRWRMSEIAAWLARQKEIDAHKKSGS